MPPPTSAAGPGTTGAMEKLFTVCIPAYEDARALERALGSLKKQTLQSWECLIGDDSDSDAIEKTVEKMQDPRIHYFRNTPAKGAPGNWNSLIAMAGGKYVTLLHQDDFYVQHTVLERVLSALDGGDAQCAVCSYSIWKNSARRVLCNRKAHVRSFLPDFPQRSLIINRIGHPSVVFFANRLKTILFDEDLCYFADTDWYARLWQAAGEPAFVADAEIGVEKGNEAQVSQKCIRNFGSIDAELERTFRKWETAPAKIATGFARLYASHLRHLPLAWPALRNRVRSFSPGQRGLFGGAFFLLFWHMGYRAVRKYVCRRPWV